ncbi:MAG: hypothetical protein GF419_06215 [Ignavibacteriales bacterium]|nr:hypothetical protein [Ignavibacteriales bacterium]
MKITLLSIATALAVVASARAGVHPDGEARRVIDATKAHMFMAPEYSPDGTYLAFTAENYRGVWIRSTATGEVRQLSDDLAAGFDMQWSNDSKDILHRAAVYQDKRRYDAAIRTSVTGEEEPLTNFQIGMPFPPRWIDGDRKALLLGENGIEIAPTGKKISDEAARANAKPVVGWMADKIALIQPDGTYELIEPIEGERVLNPELSPDGESVVFEIMGGDVYVMRLDDRSLVNLGEGDHPTFSPDGAYVAYTRSEDDGYRYLASEIYVVGADGAGLTKLTDTPDRLERHPDFSPDGTRLAFSAIDDGGVYELTIVIE